MKLKSILLTSIALAAALSSCNAVYEDLTPCPQGADFRLQYTHNMSGEDDFAAKVHCPVLFLYDNEGNFVEKYEFDDTGFLSLELEEGAYHAISFGGMNCPEADFVFNQDFLSTHHYTELETYIRGTRGGESSKRLHPQHHATQDFTVVASPDGHSQVTLDFVKNTNLIKTELAYSDGSPINPADFGFIISADNASTSHDNKVKYTGKHTIYRPHDIGTEVQGISVNGKKVPTAWAEMTIGRLETDMDAALRVTRMSDSETVVNIPLIEYFAKIKDRDLNNKDLLNSELQDYLDRQDEWTLSFIIDPETNLFIGMSFKINDWTVIFNEFDL